MKTRTIRRIGKGGKVHVRQVQVQPAALPECAWCRSTDHIQRVGLDGWNFVMVCPDHLVIAFQASKEALAAQGAKA